MSKYRKSRTSAQPDLTPLIDVVFLLIIFFMVTTTFNNFGSVQIDLPSSTIQQKEKNKSHYSQTIHLYEIKSMIWPWH